MCSGKGKTQTLLVTLLCLVITAFISYIQHISGHELAFTLFYLFPIILSTWRAGIWSGIFISFAGSALWLVTDFLAIKAFSNDLIPYFNATFRLIGFLIITYIVSELRNALHRHKDLASTDPLTSILNKRAFYELSTIELHKAKRHGHIISVLCIDLDNFKEVNDTLGHNTGDVLLKVVAGIIMNNVRKIDLVGRLGGDEFAILLSGEGAESAYIVANKLRHILLAAMKNNDWPVTFSIGLATFLKPPPTVERMIEKGDILMYTAKKNGKNMIKHLIITD